MADEIRWDKKKSRYQKDTIEDVNMQREKTRKVGLQEVKLRV